MGKPTGFIEYGRQELPSRSPQKRVEDFAEFHAPLDAEERRRQAGRCMNCGVPFCQSGCDFGGVFGGCPLHNLVPEWNDELWHGHWEEGLMRLLKTNPFPEFTGRVCPALCESACTEGIDSDPVTVRDNELAIVEQGFASGYMVPRPPLVRSGKRVAVIGSGPAGLATADALNRRGHIVTVYERADAPGGLLMYGIPNMKLDKEIVRRRIALLEAEGVRFCTSCEVGSDITAEALRGENDAVVLAVGSRVPRDIAVEGRDARGVHFAVDYLTAATKSLTGDPLPGDMDACGKNVVIIGGGDTGNDCVGTAIRQGCRSVIQLEMAKEPPLDRAPDNPWPGFRRTKKTDYGQQEAIARFGEDPRRFETTATQLVKGDEGQVTGVVTTRVEMKIAPGETRPRAIPVEGTEQTVPCDLLLIAAGFVGCEEGIAEAFGLARTNRGCIETVGNGYATTVPGVFAAGDARRGQSLVVWAIAEGRECAEAVDAFLI